MKRLNLLLPLLALWMAASCTSKKEQELAFIQKNVEFSAKQTELMLQQTGEPTGKNFPRTIDAKGQFRTTSAYDWTPGFFPGCLWYLYELTGENQWKEHAEKWTEPLKKIKNFTGNHDIGFMMYCSYGNADRLASKEPYQGYLIESAEALCTRYNPNVKAIESWDYRKAWNGNEWFYPVIIDNMMNLELLFYASKVSGNPKYKEVAVNHANTTLANHFRDDFSSYHVIDYDTISGKPLHKQTCQGYSDNSTWSRGQAWAVYGYTMVYRETKDPKYLEAAKNFADYFIRNLPEDKVPMWDFNAGQAGFTPDGDSYAKVYPDVKQLKDASAAAVVCSALFELAEYAQNPTYTETAIAMLKSLSSPAYQAELGKNANFIIMHCTGSLPHKAEIDAPLTYADYYYLEALVRYKNYLQKQG